MQKIPSQRGRNRFAQYKTGSDYNPDKTAPSKHLGDVERHSAQQQSIDDPASTE
jgi:hypothetical protein